MSPKWTWTNSGPGKRPAGRAATRAEEGGPQAGRGRDRPQGRREARGVDEIIAEAAGIVGVDPDPFTLRELLLMAEGRAKFVWGVASSLMALLANLQRTKKSDVFRPSDFNPFALPPRKPLLKGAEMKEALKAAFCH